MAEISVHNIKDKAKLKAIQDRLFIVESREDFDPTTINNEISGIRDDLDAVELRLNGGLLIPVLTENPTELTVGKMWMIDEGGA